MPRTSAAALAISGNGHIDLGRRPGPPSDLTSEEAKVWKDVVNSMEPDWFPKETHGALAQYCRLIVDARRHSEIKHAYWKKKNSPKEFSVTVYRRLVKEEVAISHMIATYARNMRLSQGSTSRQEYVKKRPMTTTPRPWDDDNDDDADDDSETEN